MSEHPRGISLIEMMIIVVLISVIATAFWTAKIRRQSPPEERTRYTYYNDSIKSALDEISYHLKFAGLGNSETGRPLSIVHEEKGDRLGILHNGARYEYFIDSTSNLVRKVGQTREVLASQISSLRVFVTGKETIVVTISIKNGIPIRKDGSRELARSFSTAVTADGLM